MRVAAGIILALLFFAGLVVATLREAAVECELCLTFNGRQECRSASAADRDHAIQMARSSACAVLAGGVTQSIQCTSTRPDSLQCRD